VILAGRLEVTRRVNDSKIGWVFKYRYGAVTFNYNRNVRMCSFMDLLELLFICVCFSRDMREIKNHILCNAKRLLYSVMHL
jgi:hypothetical protein